MSYALSMIENKPGSPERPLSDLGHRVYVSFWTRRVVNVLLEFVKADDNDVSIRRIGQRTGMIESDILYIVDHHRIKRDDTLFCDQKYLEGILKLAGRPGRAVNMANIRWKPFNIIIDMQE